MDPSAVERNIIEQPLKIKGSSMYILNNMVCVVEIIQYKRFDWQAQTISLNPFPNDQFFTLSN